MESWYTEIVAGQRVYLAAYGSLFAASLMKDTVRVGIILGVIALVMFALGFFFIFFR